MATTTRERPIIFSGPMVRAILDGRKTQTRRIVKGCSIWSFEDRDGQPWPGYCDDAGDWQWMRCPYGVLGDRLWVRESHWYRESDGIRAFDDGGFTTHPTSMIGSRHFPCDSIEADACSDDWPKDAEKYGFRRIPSIHMPRWASRITLEVTGVRVERVQDISEGDAKAEGVEECVALPGDRGSFLGSFSHLWESINGEGSWGANQWVWVIQFRRVER